MKKFLAFVAFLLLGATTTVASAYDKPGFPRTAVLWIGNQNYQDPNIQKQLAQGNLIIISFWPGWESGRGTTIEQVMRNVKAQNPKALVFNYIANMEIKKDRSNTPFSELYAKLDSMNWYVYSSGGCCSIVDSSYPGAVLINNTLFSPPDANGDRWPQWYAKWAVSKYSTPNPSLDGFFTDNVFWKPRVSADYDRNGLLDLITGATTQLWYRQGEVSYFQALRNAAPSQFQLGNVADWGDSAAQIGEYNGMLNGGVMEGLAGTDYAVESWGGWQQMMSWYRKTMAAFAEPRLGIFHMVGSATDYQGFRYGLASCLMDDGYFAYSTSEAYGDAPKFDEYSANLGAATSAPATSAWQKGVYRRDFQNGIVLVNPKGNGPQTVTLEGDFKRLSGTQAPSVNNGQTVRTITLQDRDGIILLRPARAAPAAPTGLTIQ